MRVLIIGGEGRAHAIGWSLLRSNHQVFAAPGNPGMSADGIDCFSKISVQKPDDIILALDKAAQINADLTVVSPELPLSLGIVDQFNLAKLPIVGPTKSAAMLETSKVFAKEFMRDNGIPTADFEIFSDPHSAKARVHKIGRPFVVKADGLAAGKGVTVADSIEDTCAAIDKIMVEKIFGAAGSRIVLEQRLEGQEASLIYLCDGLNAVPLKPARDYKDRFDGDKGPKTGSMGAYAPVSDVDDSLVNQVLLQIVLPTLRGMARLGAPFHGFFYVGLMLTADGGKVLEFNVRLGDPEASVILPLLEDDLGELLLASTRLGGLKNIKPKWSDGAAVCVIPCAKLYPAGKSEGKVITGLTQAAQHALIFHAGTARKNGEIVTAGGRIVEVVGRGCSVNEAALRAYEAVTCINFEDKDCRSDIGA